jgi:hypothetical protein
MSPVGDEHVRFGGQLDLSGNEILTPPAFNPERARCSVASMLNAEKLGLDPAKYHFIQPEMVEAVRPDNMRNFMIDVPPSIQDSPFVVSYTDMRTHNERYIAVTAPVAKILPRSIPALSNNARIHSRAKVSGPVIADSDQARSERASIHAQESKLPVVTTYLNSLEGEQKLIARFEKASQGRNIGLSMFGKEGTFRERFAYLQTYIIDDMVRAYGEQRRLPESSMKRMADTLTYAITLSPHRFGNFNAFMNFALEYNAHKQELTRQRKVSIERNIGAYATKIAH